MFCSSSSSSGCPARHQLQEQQHQAGFMAAAAADRIQVSSTSNWPYKVPAGITWSDIFLVGWRDANQVQDLSYRWLKSEEAVPYGLGRRGHVLRLEPCDFFLGKLTMGLLSRKRESKSWKQAQNNKIWIHIYKICKLSYAYWSIEQEDTGKLVGSIRPFVSLESMNPSSNEASQQWFKEYGMIWFLPFVLFSLTKHFLN